MHSLLRKISLLYVALIVIIFSIYLWLTLRTGSWLLTGTNSWSRDRSIDTYDFIATPEEEACLYGNASTEAIPNVVHVMQLRDHEIEFPTFLSIRSALISLKPDVLKLHHTGNLNLENEFLLRLMADPQLKLVEHDAEVLARQMSRSSHVAHIADVLRLQVIRDDGGIYHDTDVYALQSFDRIRHAPCDVVLGHEGGNRWGLCNAIIVARPHAAFIDRWITSYDGFRSGEWNDHSVLLPKAMSEQYPEEVCTLAPHIFFWPTWTGRDVKWMHEELSENETTEAEDMLRANRGSYWEGQLAYHAWAQISRGPYLSPLHEHSVKQHIRGLT